MRGGSAAVVAGEHAGLALAALVLGLPHDLALLEARPEVELAVAVLVLVLVGEDVGGAVALLDVEAATTRRVRRSREIQPFLNSEITSGLPSKFLSSCCSTTAPSAATTRIRSGLPSPFLSTVWPGTAALVCGGHLDLEVAVEVVVLLAPDLLAVLEEDAHVGLAVAVAVTLGALDHSAVEDAHGLDAPVAVLVLLHARGLLVGAEARHHVEPAVDVAVLVLPRLLAPPSYSTTTSA